MKIPASISLTMLLVLTLAGVAYMSIAVLDFDPRRETHRVTVLLASSGGLMETSQVDLRGMKIGRVENISSTPSGLAVDISIDAAHPVPANSEVWIANLSAAGEQFMDFRPTSTEGPFLTDGSVIPVEQVRVSATVSDTLAKVDTLTSQVDPATLERLVATFTAGFEGRDADVDNIGRAVSMFAQMLHDKNAELTRLYDNVQTLGDNFDGYGSVLGSVAPAIEGLKPDALQIVTEFEHYSHVGENVWEHPIGPLVDRIGGYVGLLAPDLALFASIVKPSTERIKPLRIDTGSIIDVLLTIFPDGGPARIRVTVPE